MKNILTGSVQKILAIFAFSLLFCFSGANAQTGSYGKFSNKVIRGNPTTFQDLFEKAFPGAKKSEYESLTADRTIPIREIYNESNTKIYINSVSVSFREDLTVQTAKEKYLIILMDVNAQNER